MRTLVYCLTTFVVTIILAIAVVPALKDFQDNRLVQMGELLAMAICAGSLLALPKHDARATAPAETPPAEPVPENHAPVRKVHPTQTPAHDPPSPQRVMSGQHSWIAAVLGVLAAFAIIATIMGIFIPSFALTLPAAIAAMVLGSYAFKHAELSARLIPPPIPEPKSSLIHKTGPFLFTLKDRSEYIVQIAIEFSFIEDPPQAIERIKARIQRRLREHFLEIDTLPPRPLNAIDAVLEPEIEWMRHNLNTITASLRAIEIESGSVSPGVFTGEEWN